MGPAEGERHRGALGEDAIAAIPVDLQDALEPGKMSSRPLGLAIGRIDVSHAGRTGAIPRGDCRARAVRSWCDRGPD
jgi:hypothetical protein